MINLSGRVVLVPGASGSIGSGIAEVLAECGADLVLGYHSNSDRALVLRDKLRSFGKRVRLDQVDITNYDAAKGWVEAVNKEFGPIDVLASCVGSSGGGLTLFHDQAPEIWGPLISIQFFAPVFLAHILLPDMIKRGRGRLIMLSSDGAKVGQSGLAVANGGNAGVIGFCKSIAREVARHGVTVNVVCAGPTRSRFREQSQASSGIRSKISDAVLRAVPMKREGDPRELGNMFAFLASDAGGYITGQAISVSGGLTMA